MKVQRVSYPGYSDGITYYLASGYIGGRYYEGLGCTHSHAITVVLCKVLAELID